MDLFFEEPTRSGYPLAMSFNQPEAEALLEKAVLDRKIPLIRGYGKDTFIPRNEFTCHLPLTPYAFCSVTDDGSAPGPSGLGLGTGHDQRDEMCRERRLHSRPNIRKTEWAQQ